MSRDIEADLLLACARSKLGIDPKADIPSLVRRKINWERALHLAGRHGAVPILYRSLSTLPGQAIPPSVLDGLRDQDVFYLQRNRALTESLALSDLLREEKLPTLSFKGPELASIAYQDSTLRPFGDIDLLVQLKNVPRVSALLESQGYRLKAEGDWERFFVKDGGLGIDLHWKLGPEWLPPSDSFEDMWDRSQQVAVGSTTVTTLATEDLLVVMAILLTRDVVRRRQRLIQICDAALLVRSQPSIDWPLVLERGQRLGARRMLLFQVALAHLVLGPDLPAQLATSIKEDTVAQRLARETRARLFAEADRHRKWDPSETRPGPGFTGHSFLLRSLEHPGDRARYLRVLMPGLCRRAVTPTARDREFVALPALFSPLYYLVRPVRVLWRFLRTGYLILD